MRKVTRHRRRLQAHSIASSGKQVFSPERMVTMPKETATNWGKSGQALTKKYESVISLPQTCLDCECHVANHWNRLDDCRPSLPSRRVVRILANVGQFNACDEYLFFAHCLGSRVNLHVLFCPSCIGFQSGRAMNRMQSISARILRE